MTRREKVPAALVLAIVAFCLDDLVLQREFEVFREWEALVLSLRWILLLCLSLWCSAFIFLKFNFRDFLLIGFLFLALARCLISTQPFLNGITLLFGITLGKGAHFALLDVFDGGFFKLPTAAMFWVLLELGSQIPKPFCPNQPAGSTSSAETRGPTS